MREYYPILVISAAISLLAVGFIVAFSLVKGKKEAFGFDRNMSDRELIKRLFAYAKPYKWNFAAALGLMFFSIIYEILAPYVIGVVEEIIKTPDFELSHLVANVILYAGVLIVSLVSSYFLAVILQKTGQMIISRIREDAFSHIESLSHAQLSETPVGKLVTRVSNDAESVSKMFTNVLVNLIKNAFLLLGVTVAMFALNVSLALLVMCFVPFIVLFTVMFRKFSRMAYRKEKECTTDINTFLSANISGIKITRNFNRTDYKSSEFALKSRKHGKAMMNTIFVFGVFRPVVYMLYISSVIFLFYFGARGYLDGATVLGSQISSGVIVSFYMYISTFFDPVQDIAEKFNVMQSAFASAEKIFSIMDLKPTVTDREDAEELEFVRGDIEFQGVWFAYKEDRWVIKDLSFKINAGETVAFVGATGSGKTTILSLLCRNYDVQKGRILLDGKDIRRFKISSLRRRFGQMLQDVFLFAGTIRSNITMRDDISDEKIMEACRYVNADKLIEKLPNGLDEEVKERSNNFSAGERQLLSFARMIIHRPEIMILDEATANIDTETEVLIQNSLEKLMKMGTMLVVAHRLSTIQHADKIIVLSGGKIVESGNHGELLEKKGRYYELYSLQYRKNELTAR
ncbi:MAG: ABC transporter ATP-binding protein [Clostridia bacterium]|nr:ABC transporter ATP-binding protein [Clostridia bacterium]